MAVVVAYVTETELLGARKKTVVAVRTCLSRSQIAEPHLPSACRIDCKNNGADAWLSLSDDDHTGKNKLVCTVKPDLQHGVLSCGRVPLHVLVDDLFTVSRRYWG